jgi:hypothetical protein
MTFDAMAPWQAWLLLAGTGALAAWLFLLKVRPPRVVVPSLLLWRRVLDESREITLWERIRRAVSLAVAVAVALALALAVTRPSRVSSAAAASGERRLVVIDSSWSMLARTRSGERRWDRAVAEARRLIASGGEVALATTADGLVGGPTTDLPLVEAALDRLSPAGGEGTSWPRLNGADAVHFMTDGALIRPLEADVIVHSVFEPAANVAITALDVRPSIAGANAGDAYLEIANFSPSAQRVGVTATRGTAAVLSRRADMAAGETLRQVIPLERGPAPILHVRIDAPSNALDVDDDAYAWIADARPLAVAVVGQHPDWLRALLDRDPGVRATCLDPSAYRRAGDDVDVVIFDRWAPADPPLRPALCFAPPPGTPWLSADSREARAATAPPEERRPRWESTGVHPVVRGVDPFTLIVETARGYGSSALMPVAQSIRGTPLVYVGESPARRVVVVTFGPAESNLTSAPAFPVLVGNSLEWLSRPASGPPRQPGLALFGAAIAKVTGPRGALVPLVRVNQGAVAALRAPGVYDVESGGAHSAVVVNVGDPQLSNLMRTGSVSGRSARVVTGGASGRPWWVYCAAAAFALALTEWWTWQRRITV